MNSKSPKRRGKQYVETLFRQSNPQHFHISYFSIYRIVFLWIYTVSNNQPMGFTGLPHVRIGIIHVDRQRDERRDGNPKLVDPNQTSCDDAFEFTWRACVSSWDHRGVLPTSRFLTDNFLHPLRNRHCQSDCDRGFPYHTLQKWLNQSEQKRANIDRWIDSHF